MSHLDYRRSYRRNLPHIQPPGAILFVTFRLAGSLPQNVINQWKEESAWLLRLSITNPSRYEEVKDQFKRAWFRKFDRLLDDAAVGPVWLSDERVAAIVAESLHYRDGKVYRLDAYSIMPNHVHAVFKPLLIRDDESEGYYSLASIMQSLKGYTASKCNQLLGLEGEFWAHESYDHWVRDDEEWLRILTYVINNPVKAGYVDHWEKWKWNYRRPVAPTTVNLRQDRRRKANC